MWGLPKIEFPHPTHALHLPIVCRKTLAKGQIQSEDEKMQKQRKAVKQDKIIIAESLNGLLLWWLSGKESACNAEDTGEAGSVPGQEDPLEEAMATHSSIFVSRIPWTEETGGLQSLGSQRVRYD